MSRLSSFVKTCHQNPAARCSLAEFGRAFRATLAPDEAVKWSRTRMVSELSRDFAIGTDGRGVAFVAGLALSPPSGWVVDEALVRA